MKTLTPKQKSFVEVYMLTHNKSEAYRQAYDTSLKHNASYIAKKADEVFDSPVVFAEIQRRNALIQKLDDDADSNDIITARRKWSRQDSIDALIDTYSASSEEMRREILDDEGFLERIEYNPVAANVVIKAVEAINKMLGYNEPEKSQVDATISVELGDLTDFAV